MTQLFRVEQSEKTSDDYLTPLWVFLQLDGEGAMTTTTGFAGRLRTAHGLPSKGRSWVGLRRLPQHVAILYSFACRIDDHFSCLTVACCCGCHEEAVA